MIMNALNNLAKAYCTLAKIEHVFTTAPAMLHHDDMRCKCRVLGKCVYVFLTFKLKAHRVSMGHERTTHNQLTYNVHGTQNK